jgi:hypothetical protein
MTAIGNFHQVNDATSPMAEVVSLHADRPKPARDRRRPAPKHLGRPEARLWRDLTLRYHFDEMALIILELALVALMRARRCRQQIAADGEVVEGPRGEPQAHPLLICEKMSREGFMSAMRALRLGFVST